MKAFFVHDKKKQSDLMVVPETDTMIAVNQKILEEFIAVTPDFTKYPGEHLNRLPPDTLGIVVATRKSDGDVCIIEEALWQQRMVYHFGR
jgi:hypothetical protein